MASLFNRPRFNSLQETFVLEAVLNGEPPIDLAGGNVGWATGAQYRTTDCSQRIGSDFYNAHITPSPVQGSRTVRSRPDPRPTAPWPTPRRGSRQNCQLTTAGLKVDSFISHDLTDRWAMDNDLTLSASVLSVPDVARSRAPQRFTGFSMA